MRIRIVQVAALAAGLVFVSSASANMLVNPGFDDNGGSLDGWIAFGNAYSDTATFRSAPGSAKLFGNFNPWFDVTGIFQEFPAAPGDVFTLDGYSRHNTGDELFGMGPPNDNWAVMKIVFKDINDVEIGANEVIILDGTSPKDVWIDNAPLTSDPAPVNTVQVEAFVLFLQPMQDGGALYVDDMTFIPEPASALLMAVAALMRRR